MTGSFSSGDDMLPLGKSLWAAAATVQVADLARVYATDWKLTGAWSIPEKHLFVLVGELEDY